VSIDTPAGTYAFEVVDEGVTIIDVTRRDDVVTKSSVRLLETQLGKETPKWTDLSGPDTIVDPDMGFTVHSLDYDANDKLSILFTYVDATTGEWIYLVVKQGQSIGYELPIEIADHWFSFSGRIAKSGPTKDGHGSSGDTLAKTLDKTGASDQIKTPSTSTPTVSTPIVPETSSTAPATEGKDDGLGILEWARKFCTDRFIPRTHGTINTIFRNGVPHDHATFATSSQLWDLGGDPLLYKFMDGKHGGHEHQRQKVRKTIPEWSRYANVEFKEAGKDELAPIRITFDPSDGSWAIVGNHSCKEDEGRATMNLGWVNAFNSTLHREEQAVILHEFGHALGMFHEHQSPAHGNQTVVDPKAAIEFYKKTQGWSEEEVMEQVVRPYNERDVSNFSQVDTKSIMHYFQPSEVTSGPPIEYNYYLSDLDKAYMVINYPRSLADEKKRVNDKDWTLEAALKKAGLTGNDPTLAAKILAVRDSPGQDGIDVGQIREIFTKWAKAQHTIKDNRLRSATGNYMKGVLDKLHGLEPQGDTTLYTSEPDPFPCLYSESQKPVAGMTDPKKARAVIDMNIFARKPKLDRQDGDAGKINLTWTIVSDPTVTAGKANRNPGPGSWEQLQVEAAMAQWTPFCSINFTWVDPLDAATADLIIVFQDINPITGHTYDADNSVNASHCYPSRWTQTDIQDAHNWLKTQTPAEWDESHPYYWYAIQPPIVYDICYRGIVTQSTAGAPSTVPHKWPPMIRSKRAIVHELGHFLGLDHESIGYWSMLYEDQTTFVHLFAAANTAKFGATMFDSASVMDLLKV
jgi:hypothetical protein